MPSTITLGSYLPIFRWTCPWSTQGMKPIVHQLPQILPGKSYVIQTHTHTLPLLCWKTAHVAKNSHPSAAGRLANSHIWNTKFWLLPHTRYSLLLPSLREHQWNFQDKTTKPLALIPILFITSVTLLFLILSSTYAMLSLPLYLILWIPRKLSAYTQKESTLSWFRFLLTGDIYKSYSTSFSLQWPALAISLHCLYLNCHSSALLLIPDFVTFSLSHTHYVTHRVLFWIRLQVIQSRKSAYTAHTEYNRSW